MSASPAITYAPPSYDALTRKCLVTGIAGLVLTLLCAAISRDAFFHSYLLAFTFWIGTALGCMSLLMLNYVTGGAWGIMLRRIFEAASRTLPLMVILFLPILLGMHSLYEWTHKDVVAADAILRQKAPYLNVPFFIVRQVIYFVAWLGIMWRMNSWAELQDRTGDPAIARKLQLFSGPGLVVMGGTVTFAAVDWLMSLDPHWFSTMYPVLIIMGQILNGFGFSILVAMFLHERAPLKDALNPTHFHDLGKLLLAFVMLWAYMAFSQFLIIWTGNTVEDITWYQKRLSHGGTVIALMLILLHFALPFVLLLSRNLKRDAKKLAAIAVLILVMRVVDLFWLITPPLRGSGFHVSLTDIPALVGVGGIWIAFFLWQLGRRPLLPINEPHLTEALEHGRAKV